MRKCARAIIFDEQNRLLVFERERQDGPFRKVHHYYSIPGGGMERGETPEEAVVRELHEEMLIRIKPSRLLIHQIDEQSNRENFYFLADIVSGVPTFNPDSEEARKNYALRKSGYKVAWIDVSDSLLGYYDAYGQVGSCLQKWLRDGIFPSQVVDMRVENR